MKILTSAVAAIEAMGHKGKILTDNVATMLGDGKFPESAISNTHEKPTGRARLMHAIKLGRENYNKTTNGKRIPRKPTKKEMQKVINHMLRKSA